MFVFVDSLPVNIYIYTRKFSPPTGGFFLAPAENLRALRAQKVNLADGWTDRLTDGQKDRRTDNEFKRVRYRGNVVFAI